VEIGQRLGCESRAIRIPLVFRNASACASGIAELGVLGFILPFLFSRSQRARKALLACSRGSSASSGGNDTPPAVRLAVAADWFRRLPRLGYRYEPSCTVPAVPAAEAAPGTPPAVAAREAPAVAPRSAQEKQRTMALRPFIPGWPYHDASAAFRAWNERRRMQGVVLRAVIECLDERLTASRDRTDGSLPTAREVWLEIDPAQLGRTKRPRLRAVQAQLRCSRIGRFGIQAANRWAKRRSGHSGRGRRRVSAQGK
jgi:hypothetical protein